MNQTRFPKEDRLPDRACRDNKVTKGDHADHSTIYIYIYIYIYTYTQILMHKGSIYEATIIIRAEDINIWLFDRLI